MIDDAKIGRGEAVCRVVEFDGDEAVCRILLDGYELPRVAMPAGVLRAHGLSVGGRFSWAVRTPVGRDDINPLPAEPDESDEPSLTADELAESERLNAESEKWQHEAWE